MWSELDPTVNIDLLMLQYVPLDLEVTVLKYLVWVFSSSNSNFSLLCVYNTIAFYINHQ